MDKVSEFSKRLFNEDYKEFFYACTPYTHGMKYQSTIEDLPLMLRFAANMGGSGLYVNKLKPDGRQDKEDYKNIDEKEFWENAVLPPQNNGIRKSSYFPSAISLCSAKASSQTYG